jgi:hypothetical protein
MYSGSIKSFDRRPYSLDAVPRHPDVAGIGLLCSRGDRLEVAWHPYPPNRVDTKGKTRNG